MSLLSAIEKKIEALEKISKNGPEIAAKILEENDNIIIDMNTDDQLFDKGITSDGQKIAALDPYSPFTVKIKKAKGQPTDRVTTRDSGAFHGSFTADKVGTTIKLGATDSKTKKLLDRYGPNLFGVTDENQEELSESYVKPAMEKIIRTSLKS